MNVRDIFSLINGMTIGDGMLLRITADSGNVAVVEQLFCKYGAANPRETAEAFVEARRQAAERAPVVRLVAGEAK